MQQKPTETINALLNVLHFSNYVCENGWLGITFFFYFCRRQDSSLNVFLWLRLHFNVLLSKAASQNATPLFWLASLQIWYYQITVLIHPFTECGWTLELKCSITAVDAACQNCIYNHQKPGLRSKMPYLFFCFFFFCDPTEPLQTGSNQVCTALTSAARRNAGIWSWWPQGNLTAPGPIAIPALPLLLYPPELWWASEGCCHSNGQACWCPWGLLFDRIPWRPLPAKGWALMAERLCMLAHIKHGRSSALRPVTSLKLQLGAVFGAWLPINNKQQMVANGQNNSGFSQQWHIASPWWGHRCWNPWSSEKLLTEPSYTHTHTHTWLVRHWRH